MVSPLIDLLSVVYSPHCTWSDLVGFRLFYSFAQNTPMVSNSPQSKSRILWSIESDPPHYTQIPKFSHLLLSLFPTFHKKLALAQTCEHTPQKSTWLIHYLSQDLGLYATLKSERLLWVSLYKIPYLPRHFLTPATALFFLIALTCISVIAGPAPTTT